MTFPRSSKEPHLRAGGSGARGGGGGNIVGWTGGKAISGALAKLPRAFFAAGPAFPGDATAGIEGGRFRLGPWGTGAGGEGTNSYSSTGPAEERPKVRTPSGVKRLFLLESRVDIVRPEAAEVPGLVTVLDAAAAAEEVGREAVCKERGP